MPCTQDFDLLENNVVIDSFDKNLRTCEYHFVTHAHHDHFKGLNNKFRGTIVCTEITKQLLILRFPALHNFIVLTYDEPVSFESFSVIAFPAYHCDGSAMFLFKLSASSSFKRTTILYTGDFRWTEKLRSSPLLEEKVIDRVYIDDTLMFWNRALPTLEESTKQLEELMNKRDNWPIHINISMLGIEMLLRTIADKNGFRFTLSPKLRGTTREKQLLYLLDGYISDSMRPYHNAFSLNGRTPFVLDHRGLSNMKESKDTWIIPSCTGNVLEWDGKQTYLQKKSTNLHNVFICFHSNREEISRFLSLLSPKEVKYCDDDISKH